MTRGRLRLTDSRWKVEDDRREARGRASAVKAPSSLRRGAASDCLRESIEGWQMNEEAD